MFNKSILALAVLVATSASNTQAETTIPGNAGNSLANNCSVATNELSTWFAGRQVLDKGFVMPADSTDKKFNPANDPTTCDFYQWGAQMFLWLTSPMGSHYVFDGPVFYDVVHDGSNFDAIPNTGSNNKFRIRSLKTDKVDSTAQAGGGGVLISQNNSLVYYGININDVFAGYKKAQSSGKFNSGPLKNSFLKTNFPTNQTQLELVEAANKTTYPDGQALAMELKTSWVEVDPQAGIDASRYITIQAEVPDYDESDPKTWTLNDTPVTKTLALVGMHVVGSVNGHPELIWVTYEHVDNAPQKAYTYTSNMGQSINVPYDGSGKWLFAPTNAPDEDDVLERQSVDSSTGNIVAKGELPIGSAEVVRLNPWGDEPGATDAKQVKNATLLVSLNSSIMRALAQVSDVRANYFQVGGIWTSDGSVPGDANKNLAGGHYLSNSTMETYHQYNTGHTAAPKQNCFGCHFVSTEQPANLISHIYQNLTFRLLDSNKLNSKK